MADNGIGDFFISDVDDELLDEDDELIPTPVVVSTKVAAPAQAPATPSAASAGPAAQVEAVPAPAQAPSRSVAAPRPQTQVRQASREERLAVALDDLMANSQDVQAAALVSLDGFIMASALPEGMQEDRVGAMSAAILGLGERAAAELGRGHLSQVFIEGADGYVLLMAAGDRAVLTCLADVAAKLGLVLYDMQQSAEDIAGILG